MSEMPRSRTSLLSLALRLLPGLVVFAYFAIPNWLEPRWRAADGNYIAEWPLPDGNHKLRLLKIEKGLKAYDWVPSLNGSWLERIYSRPKFLPETHLKSQVEFPSDWDSVGFLFRVVDDRGCWKDGFWIGQIGIKDSHGYADGDDLNTTRENETLLLETTWVPRREKDLTIQLTLWDFDHPGKAVEFQTPNPFYEEKFPEWKPELEMMKTIEGRTVWLQQSGPHSRGIFELRELLSPGNLETCESVITLEDPTGNCGKMLSPFERVWKVKADVFPLLQKIAPDSIRHRQSLTIPPKSNTVRLDKSVQVRGATLKLLAVCGGGAVSDLGTLPFQYQLRSAYGEDSAFVVVQAENIQREEGIAIRSTYRNGVAGKTLSYRDNGKPIVVEVGQFQHHPKEVTLEIAESSPQRFEYFVEPPKYLREQWQVDTQPPE